jgi:hypothetical protein
MNESQIFIDFIKYLIKDLSMDEPVESLSKKVLSYLLPAACAIILGFIFYRVKFFSLI